ncbi:hypothetical protein, partial [Burkholderia anthina]|uniref:hypothetical protein n=1 Tax=Burkholderia anthina TaxID=179879 RepID=UPI001EEFDB16
MTNDAADFLPFCVQIAHGLAFSKEWLNICAARSSIRRESGNRARARALLSRQFFRFRMFRPPSYYR